MSGTNRCLPWAQKNPRSSGWISWASRWDGWAALDSALLQISRFVLRPCQSCVCSEVPNVTPDKLQRDRKQLSVANCFFVKFSTENSLKKYKVWLLICYLFLICFGTCEQLFMTFQNIHNHQALQKPHLDLLPGRLKAWDPDWKPTTVAQENQVSNSIKGIKNLLQLVKPTKPPNPTSPALEKLPSWVDLPSKLLKFVKILQHWFFWFSPSQVSIFFSTRYFPLQKNQIWYSHSSHHEQLPFVGFICQVTV